MLKNMLNDKKEMERAEWVGSLSSNIIERVNISAFKCNKRGSYSSLCIEGGVRRRGEVGI